MTGAFTERMQAMIARHRTNTLVTAPALDEFSHVAKHDRAAYGLGDDAGFPKHEVAFQYAAPEDQCPGLGLAPR